MMGRVPIAHVTDTDTTAISNYFIDNYMTRANGAQIKIYLYLLRMMQSGSATNVSLIADTFNLTEKDVKRALAYWEKERLLRLEYDLAGHLKGIFLEDIVGQGSDTEAHSPLLPSEVGRGSVSQNYHQVEMGNALPPEEEAIPVPKRRSSYDDAELDDFTHDETLGQIMFIAHQYFKKPLDQSETNAILYIYNELGFDQDLIDYLLQYTAENARGRRSRYMETIAVNWYQEGIRTVSDVKSRSGRYDKKVYEVMRALGLENAPTDTEVSFINKWFDTYGFSMELVLEACSETVLKTQRYRLRYADTILRRWHEEGVKTMDDVMRLKEQHKASQKPVVKSTAQHTPLLTDGRAANGEVDLKNRFNRFTQHEYDFEAIKRSVVSNH